MPGKLSISWSRSFWRPNTRIPHDIPSEVVEKAKVLLLDTIGRAAEAGLLRS